MMRWRFNLALLCLAATPLALAGQAPTCSVTATTTPPAYGTCHQQGKVLAGACIGRGPAASQTACRDRCLANTACASFSYASKSRTCELYKKKARESRFQRCSSGVYFWDRGCYTQTCTCPRDSGTTLCGSGANQSCIDTTSDENNCGACGTQCASDETCSASGTHATCDGANGCCFCEGPNPYQVTRAPPATYTRTYSGHGQSWPFTNFQAFSNFPGSERRACDVLEQCLTLFLDNSFPHINLWWDTTTSQWFCVHSNVPADTSRSDPTIGASLVFAPAT